MTLDVDSAADVPAPVQSVAYRIVQEALTNVARHAQASATTVSVRRVPGAITVDVTDDGAAPAQAGHRRDPRATACGACASGPPRWAGASRRAPADGGGWRVHAWLPMSAPASNGAPVTAGEHQGGELRR